MDNKYVAYAGSYTHESNKGIYIYDMDVSKGRITERSAVNIDNPSYITISHNKKYLYSICDQGVTSFYIKPDGNLEKINTASINGMRGCHLTLTKKDDFIIVSGFHDGKITVLRLLEDGSVGQITDEVFHKGLGSISERSFRPHVRCSVFTPDESLLCACDLGIDQIKLYAFDHNTGRIKLDEILRTQLDSAPKQMLFSPDGRFAYVVCELKNYINVYSYTPEADKEPFQLIQNIFTVRKDHKVNSAATCMVFSNSGNNLLCTNAGDNTVTIYKVNKETGKLDSLSSLPVSGDYPKYVNIFPDDKHILSMNNEGNSITIFTVDFERGLIVMNGPELRILRPNNLIIHKLQ